MLRTLLIVDEIKGYVLDRGEFYVEKIGRSLAFNFSISHTQGRIQTVIKTCFITVADKERLIIVYG